MGKFFFEPFCGYDSNGTALEEPTRVPGQANPGMHDKLNDLVRPENRTSDVRFPPARAHRSKTKTDRARAPLREAAKSFHS